MLTILRGSSFHRGTGKLFSWTTLSMTMDGLSMDHPWLLHGLSIYSISWMDYRSIQWMIAPPKTIDRGLAHSDKQCLCDLGRWFDPPTYISVPIYQKHRHAPRWGVRCLGFGGIEVVTSSRDGKVVLWNYPLQYREPTAYLALRLEPDWGFAAEDGVHGQQDHTVMLLGIIGTGRQASSSFMVFHRTKL